MKEATGELSTTAIAIVAIAAVLTIFTVVLLPRLRNSIATKTKCSSAVCSKTTCGTAATCSCTYIEEGQAQAETIICPNPYLENYRSE